MKILNKHYISICISVVLLFFSTNIFAQTDTTKVNVDGHKIYLYITGKGNNTVVFESGHGANHRSWRAVDSAIALNAKVVTYDRPGYLLSDSCLKQRDAINTATELKEALTMAGIKPPYILVGWSLGGAFARVFCGLYPSTVKGLVLVDPTPEESYARFEKEYPELLKEDSAYINEIMLSRNRPGEKAEMIAFDSSMNQARISDQYHTTPTILLIAAGGENRDQANPLNRIWVEELRKWAGKRTNLQFKIIENSGHHMAKEQPQEVIKAIETFNYK